MAEGRARVVVAVAVALALLGAAAGVGALRKSSDDGGGEQAPSRRTTTTGAGAGGDEEPAAPGEGGDGLLGRLLDALGGGGSGAAGGDATTAVVEKCGNALASVPVGSAGLLPHRKKGDASPAEQLAEIAKGLQELRQLTFEHVPEPVYVTAEEMTRRVQAEVEKSLSPEATADEARGLIALGALPDGTDLHELTAKLLGEQVAGFYDPDTGELVIAGDATSGGPDGQTRIVLAHELDHAVVDQVIGLPGDDTPDPGAADAELATLALIEGDATLAMQLYGLAYVPLLDQLTGLGGAVASSEELARMPYFVQQNLLFPYLSGLVMVCALYDAGGWGAVDAAYKAPPSSTAQVLFPERYLAGDGPSDPRDPPAPGTGWKALPRRTFGAAELRWLLEAPGGRTAKAIDHAGRRAGGWDGGELQVWTDGDRTAAGLSFVQFPGQPPLCATMAAWYTAAFPGGVKVANEEGEELAVDGTRQDAVVRCAGTDVRIGIAPDVATARTIAG